MHIFTATPTLITVISAKAGIHNLRHIRMNLCLWIPAFAGMTEGEAEPARGGVA